MGERQKLGGRLPIVAHIHACMHAKARYVLDKSALAEEAAALFYRVWPVVWCCCVCGRGRLGRMHDGVALWDSPVENAPLVFSMVVEGFDGGDRGYRPWLCHIPRRICKAKVFSSVELARASISSLNFISLVAEMSTCGR